jgi:hypothetical protein
MWEGNDGTQGQIWLFHVSRWDLLGEIYSLTHLRLHEKYLNNARVLVCGREKKGAVFMVGSEKASPRPVSLRCPDTKQLTAVGGGHSAYIGHMVQDIVAIEYRPVRVLLIVSSMFFRRPWRDRIMRALHDHHLMVVTHDGMPTPESLTRLAGMAKPSRPDIVVAVGGGSIIGAVPT